MTISISSIAAVIPNTQNTVTLNGVTIQSVDGVMLAAQPFTESRTCANDGAYTFTVTNGAGESASVSSIKESADGKHSQATRRRARHTSLALPAWAIGRRKR